MVATKSGNLGIQGKSGDFVCNKGKSRENERFSEKLGKIKEILIFILFHFRAMILNPFSITHPSESDNHQILRFCLSFCPV